jgi:hypothetical protein
MSSARLIGALLAGVAIGVAACFGVAGLVAAVLTVAYWGSTPGDPLSRARTLSESISEGVNVGMIAGILLIPACTVMFVRRTVARAEKPHPPA